MNTETTCPPKRVKVRQTNAGLEAEQPHWELHLVDLAAELREDAGSHPDLVEQIDLGASGELGRQYELATAYAIKYEAVGLPAQDQLESDLKRLLEILDGVLIETQPDDDAAPATATPGFDWPWLLDHTNWSADELTTIRDAVRDGNAQTIFAGPPGTSKTWIAKAIVRHLTGGDAKRMRIVQFHPSYGYEDFIEGLRPIIDDGGRVNFQPVPGEVLQYVDDMGSEPESHFIPDRRDESREPSEGSR